LLAQLALRVCIRVLRQEKRAARIRPEQTPHLFINTSNTTAQEPDMKKFIALVAATVLFAPAAYAALYQAALIVA
jgi:hypothetical protein